MQQPTFSEIMQGFNTAIKQMVAETVKIELSGKHERFLQKYELDNLRGTIAAAPIEIEAKRSLINKKREQARTLRQNLADAEQVVKEAEVALIAEIAGEINAAGKPTFSNDKARQGELIQRKRFNPDYQQKLTYYQQCKKEVENLEDILASHDVKLKRMEQELDGQKAILASINAEIGYYTATMYVVETREES